MSNNTGNEYSGRSEASNRGSDMPWAYSSGGAVPF